MRTLKQLEEETVRAKQKSLELEKRAKVEEYRLEQAKQRMEKIEEEEKERCHQTAEILKEFESKSGNSPFFESLLKILGNFQGIFFLFNFHNKISFVEITKIN